MAPCDAQALIAELRARIEQLEKEKEFMLGRAAESNREISRLDKDLAHWQHCHGVTADQLAVVSAENAGLREDAARLDWLNERHGHGGKLRAEIDAARGAK